jgi:hypothetical protein
LAIMGTLNQRSGLRAETRHQKRIAEDEQLLNAIRHTIFGGHPTLILPLDGNTSRLLELSLFCVRFEVSTAVTMKNAVFWDVTPCGSCKNRRFGGT